MCGIAGCVLRPGGRPKQVGLASSASRQLLSGARPEFLDRGCLRELLGLPGLEWQSLTAGLQRRNPVALWTTEIWCRLILEGQSRATVEATLWT